MVGESDEKDKSESRKLAIALVVLVLVGVVAILLLLPGLADIAASTFSPGLGLKPAAVIAFFVSLVVMIVFAIASGDGLLGEIQFILAAFFVFFLILWLMIAWIF